MKSERGAAGGRTVEAVVFDMDGVLIDSEPIHLEATRELLADYDVEYAPDLGENFYGWTDREVFRRLRARYGLESSEEELADDWVGRAVRLLGGPLVPMAGVPGVLRQLQQSGFRLALASGSARPVIAATLGGLGIGDAFECTVSGHEVARGKPAPDIFLEAANRLGLVPDACLAVEDSQNGLAAAVAAGIRCVVVPCHSTAAQDFSAAAARLNDLTELPAWIARTLRQPMR